MTTLVFRIDIGATLQELSDASIAAFGGGVPQPRNRQIIYVNVESVSKCLSLVCLIEFQEVQGICTRLGLGKGIGPMVKKELNETDVPPQCGYVKRQYPFRAFADRCPSLDQRFTHFHVPVESSYVEDRPAFFVLNRYVCLVFE
ncbi:hypothetical protein NW767_009659 [Fusarium falciforme]|nr:hypothetical protein NW767_009659 [Fusarium falciforme]